MKEPRVRFACQGLCQGLFQWRKELNKAQYFLSFGKMNPLLVRLQQSGLGLLRTSMQEVFFTLMTSAHLHPILTSSRDRF